MTCARRGLLVLMVLAPLGLWGCAQEKNGAANTKIRDLAARNAKLEEDFRAVSASTDAVKKKLAQSEAQRSDLAKQVEQLALVTRERDELRGQLTSRTGERDAMHAQLVQFSKELQTLAGRIEAAVNSRGAPSTAASASAGQ